jgi:hypothetical protein
MAGEPTAKEMRLEWISGRARHISLQLGQLVQRRLEDAPTGCCRRRMIVP